MLLFRQEAERRALEVSNLHRALQLVRVGLRGVLYAHMQVHT